MDFEGWEVLPQDGYLQVQYDGSKKIFSRKYGDDDLNNLYKNKYFICPSQDSSEFLESSEKSRTRVQNQLIPVPIQLSLEKTKAVPDSGIPLEADYDPVSQVFFKKMVENKSVDMKMDSPKSNKKSITPQMDPGSFQFDNKENSMKDEVLEGKNSLVKLENEEIIEIKKDGSDEETWKQDSAGLNIWKWSLNGFDAICSFGFVAASVCMILLDRRNQKKQLQQAQKLQFHLFAEDKGIKQVVQQAKRLNETISTIRGVPGVGTHIIFGGSYEGL